MVTPFALLPTRKRVYQYHERMYDASENNNTNTLVTAFDGIKYVVSRKRKNQT